MEITYRTRSPAELADTSRLIERVFREEFDLPLAGRLDAEISELTARFDASRDLFITADMENRPVGALLITHEDEPESGALFSWLVVESAARGHGIGRELLFRGMETCRQRGLVLLRARSFAFSPAAPHLYWLHGFRVCGVTATEIAGRKQETLLFERRLTPPTG